MILHMHSAHIHTNLLVEFQSSVCIHYKVMDMFALLLGSPSYLRCMKIIKKMVKLISGFIYIVDRFCLCWNLLLRINHSISRVMRAYIWHMHINKTTDQLSSVTVFPLFSLHRSLYNFEPQAIFCGSTARFVTDLLGDPKDMVSLDAA